MAFGADLVIKSKENHDQILKDGKELGKCIIEATEKYSAPLALPYMDLKIEKEDMLNLLEIPPKEIEKFHFESGIDDDYLEKLKASIDASPTERMKATCDAIHYVGANSDYLPMGMCIGPFSLYTKLVSEPITPVFMKSMGVEGDTDQSVKDLDIVLEMALLVIERWIKMQIEAGAKAVCVCEPAANSVYISPDILTENAEDIYDRLVINANKRLCKIMAEHDVDLILHNCGELTDIMVKKMCKLDPAVLSLGSSRVLWEDAKLIPDNIVIFGNLPTKQFFLDDTMTKEKVKVLTEELDNKMKDTGHPFVLASECDILYVEGYVDSILSKVDIMLDKNT